MVAFDDFILMTLHPTFCGTPNLSQWSDISELFCDMGNNIVQDEGWVDPPVF